MPTRPWSSDDPRCLYDQVADWMLGRIRGGAWPLRHQLKAEEDLARELGVSRGTLRQAIGRLVRQGILTPVHGRGTFVTSVALQQPLAQRLISTAEAFDEQGLAYTTKVLKRARVPAPPPVAGRLQVREGEAVFFLERLRLHQGVPVVLLRNYVRLDLCPDVARADYRQATLFETIEKSRGARIAWGRRSFEARPAGPAEAARLRVPRGAPLLVLEQVVFTKGDVPIETSDVWIRSDRFRVTSVMRR
jgi:DNA-binding GntR family transcriptional regulator